MDTKTQAYNRGKEAVRSKPRFAPQNPYDATTEAELHEAWDNGAYEVGLSVIYTNGILDKEYR